MSATSDSERQELSQQLSSNNPYRAQEARQQDATYPGADTMKEVQQSIDSEKQVVAHEQQSGAGNSPIVYEKTQQSRPEPVREADKEVTSSWQSTSREDGAPIPVQQDQAQSFHNGVLNDMKGEPPAYDSLNRQSHSQENSPISGQASIEPDSESNLPPRPEDRSTVGQLLSWVPPAPSQNRSQMPPLIQPIVIPQLDVPPQGESVPFSRCYSDALSLHGIPMREFASFLDGLALAQAPNSALQGLKMFGAGMKSIPIPFIPLAGKGIAALATSGSGHSGSRARLYIDRAKTEYFEPRGLRLSIIKDVDLSPRLQIPTHAYRLAPLTNSTLTENLSKRRFEGLAPYVAPLRYDMPDQDKQIQGVHKMARKHLESRFKDQSKKLSKMREDQSRNLSHTTKEAKGWDDRYKAKMTELRSLQLDMIREQQSSPTMSSTLREMTQALDQLQKDLQLLISERQTAMQNVINGEKGVEAEMKEIKWSERLKWIVIENLQ